MAGTRKLLARYGTVILVTSAAAHSAFAPLKGRVQAATAHPTPKTQTPIREKSPATQAVSSELTADPIVGFPVGTGDSKLPPLQSRLNKPISRTPASTLLDPLPATTISLLKTTGVTRPVPPNSFEPPLPPPVFKSAPPNLDPAGGLVGTAPQNPTDVVRIGNTPGGPRPIPEPITTVPLAIIALLGRSRRLINH